MDRIQPCFQRQEDLAFVSISLSSLTAFSFSPLQHQTRTQHHPSPVHNDSAHPPSEKHLLRFPDGKQAHDPNPSHITHTRGNDSLGDNRLSPSPRPLSLSSSPAHLVSSSFSTSSVHNALPYSLLFSASQCSPSPPTPAILLKNISAKIIHYHGSRRGKGKDVPSPSLPRHS